MTMLLGVLIFMFGAILGSFFNVIGMRLPRGESFIGKERSRCDSCKKVLKWYHLIPIVSYLLQVGRCDYCGAGIGKQHLYVELATATLFTIAYSVFGLEPELIVALLFISMSVIIVIADIHYMIIPNSVLLFFLPVFLLARGMIHLESVYDGVITAIIAFIVIVLIIIISKGGMGMGDAKLYAMIGLVLGSKLLILTFILSLIIGSTIGLYLRYTGKLKKKAPFPFGPSIIAGALLAYFWGQPVIDWYLSLL